MSPPVGLCDPGLTDYELNEIVAALVLLRVKKKKIKNAVKDASFCAARGQNQTI